MKDIKSICFICASLEKGRDGVGDYSRVLGQELVKQGYRVSILALNDKFCHQALGAPGSHDQAEVQYLRLPSIWKTQKKIEVAREWVAGVNPDWISFQFVIYSYNNKGLPVSLARYINLIAAGRRWHIMFHEIYIGFTRISPWKHRLIGYLQRQILLRIITAINPRLITTTNALYQAILLKDNIDSQILPLFSNILIAAVDNDFVSNMFQNLGIESEDRKNFVFAGLFGNITSGKNLEKTIQQQITIAKNASKGFVILTFGRMNESGLSQLKYFQKVFPVDIKFLNLGEQSDAKISSVIQQLDIAFSCTPEQHIGKSGIYAAFRLHGVKVYVFSAEVIPEYKSIIDNAVSALQLKPPLDWSVNQITGQFIKLLTHAN